MAAGHNYDELEGVAKVGKMVCNGVQGGCYDPTLGGAQVDRKKI